MPIDDLVSVVIPTLRGEHTIEEAVQSALNQTHGAVEVLVVLDGPGEGVRQALSATSDPRLRIVEADGPSGGPAAPRNLGVSISNGGWVALLDDDDVWVRDKLQAQLTVAHAQRAELVYSRATVDEVGVFSDFHSRWAPHLDSLPQGDVLGRSGVGAVAIPTSSVLVRRHLLREAGGFRTNLGTIDDYDMWLRLALRGARFAAVDRRLYRYRFGEGGVSHRDPHRERIEMRVRMWRQLLRDFPERESLLVEALRQEEQQLAEIYLRGALSCGEPRGQRLRRVSSALRMAPSFRTAHVLASLLKDRAVARDPGGTSHDQAREASIDGRVLPASPDGE